jgi:hypothetical protein
MIQPKDLDEAVLPGGNAKTKKKDYNQFYLHANDISKTMNGKYYYELDTNQY